MSWLSEWLRKGKVRLPEKYNSIGDIRKALEEDLTPEDIAKIAKAVNRVVDIPDMDEAQEEKLITTILSYGLKALMGG